MYVLETFAGAMGCGLGSILLEHTIIGAVEIEEYPQRVIKARQEDGFLPWFPIWDDIKTFRSSNPKCSDYFKLLRSIKDQLIVAGGFPCQDISSAGKGKGIKKGTRSGLWFELCRTIGEIRPAVVFLENSPLLVSRGLDIVLSDLAEMGYNAKWGIISAENAGAPHQRKRTWVLGYTCLHGQPSPEVTPGTTRSDKDKHLPDTEDQRVLRRLRGKGESGQQSQPEYRRETFNDRREWWKVEPQLGRVANGVANRVDRLKAIGNGQVPAVVKLAWEMLGGIEKK